MENVHSSTAFDTLTKLLSTVVLIEEVVGNLLQVCQMAVEEGGPNSKEVGVTRVINLDNTPRILASSNLAATNLDDVFGANDSKRHETSELGILLHGILVILLDVVGEIVHGNSVVLDVLHDQFLRLGQLARRKGVGSANNRDDVDTGSKSLHQFNIEFTETIGTRFVSDIINQKYLDQLTHPCPVGVMKYSMACTRLSLNLGLRLIRDSSAKMSSYCLSRYPTISEKLFQVQQVS